MKVLLLNQTFYPDESATAQYLSDVARALVARGVDVTAFSSRQNYFDSNKQFSEGDTWEGIRIERVSAIRIPGVTKLARALNALSVNISLFWKLLCSERFDAVLVLTSPPLLAFFAAIAPPLRKAKFYYWVMDLNPDQVFAARWIPSSSPIGWLLRRILRYVLARADRILVLDRFMKIRIRKYDVPDEKFIIASLWPRVEASPALDRSENPFRRIHDLRGKFVVMHSGNLSVCHPVETLLNAALELRNDEGIEFVFVGGGARAEEVRRFKELHQLKNVVCLPYEATENLRYSLAAGDLHIAIMGEEFVGIVHPSKIYGILAVSRPWIAITPELSALAEITRECGAGHVVRHGDVSAVVQIIRMEQQKSMESRKLTEESIRSYFNRIVAQHRIEMVANLFRGEEHSASPSS